MEAKISSFVICFGISSDTFFEIASANSSGLSEYSCRICCRTGKYTSSVIPSSFGLQSTKLVRSTIILERTLTSLSSVWIHTYGTAAFWISSASSALTSSPALAMISPVKGLVTSCDRVACLIRFFSASFLLNL